MCVCEYECLWNVYARTCWRLIYLFICLCIEPDQILSHSPKTYTNTTHTHTHTNITNTHTHTHTVATTIGGFLAIILIAFRQVILSKGFYVTPEALPAASAYLAIRAVSVPATLASYVGTGACLGMGDTVTPLIGIVAASLANVFGDWFLICALPFGVAGAAAATAASSYVGMFMYVQVLCDWCCDCCFFMRRYVYVIRNILHF
jgi:hypothetical protein